NRPHRGADSPDDPRPETPQAILSALGLIRLGFLLHQETAAHSDARHVKGKIRMPGSEGAPLDLSRATVIVYGLNLDTGASEQLDSVHPSKEGAFSAQARSDFRHYVVTLRGPGLRPTELLLRAEDLDSIDIDGEPLAAGAVIRERLEISFDPARRTVFPPETMTALPYPRARSFDTFVLLAPGILPPPQTRGTTGPGIAPGLGSVGQFSSNGLRSRAN